MAVRKTAAGRSVSAAKRMAGAVSKVKAGVKKKTVAKKAGKLLKVASRVKNTLKNFGTNKITHDQRQIRKMKKKLGRK